MNILFIIGSMRKTSFNRQLANEAKKIIGDRAEVSFLDYSNIPYMNQDLEADPPESIKKVKQTVNEAEAIWIFSPEYNGMIPGVLKNLLDWLSRPWIPGDYSSGSPVKGKPVTISGVGGFNATKGGRGQLDILLPRIGMKLMKEPETGLSVQKDSFATDKWTITPEDIEKLTAQVDAFLDFIKENKAS